MAAAAIGEGLDPREGLPAGLIVVGKIVSVGVFEFEGGKEGLRSGMVGAVAPAAHGGGDASGRELAAKRFAGILHAAIGVQEQAGGAIAPQRWVAINKAARTRPVSRDPEKAQPRMRLR